jgi:hypothetical protein
VVQHHIEIFDGHDGFLHFLGGEVHLCGDVSPDLVDIFRFVDVEHAGVRSQFLPYLVVEGHFSFFSEELEGFCEDVVVGGG